MTHESYAAIAFTLDDVGYELIADIRSAAARATKAEPGDRLDITRFEALSSQLEALAMTQFDQGEVRVQLDRAPPPDAVALIAPARVGEFVNAPEWLPEAARGRVQAVLNRGGVLLTVASPLQRGATARPSETIAPPRPIATWKSETDARGSAAVRERFEDQLRRAVTFGERPSPEPISPTGIQNKVLTETLREYVKKIEGQQRVDVPVEYRDGSRAEHPFPLRSLQLTSESTSRVDRDLSFALLSIRHTELDAIVGAANLDAYGAPATAKRYPILPRLASSTERGFATFKFPNPAHRPLPTISCTASAESSCQCSPSPARNVSGFACIRQVSSPPSSVSIVQWLTNCWNTPEVSPSSPCFTKRQRRRASVASAKRPGLLGCHRAAARNTERANRGQPRTRARRDDGK